MTRQRSERPCGADPATFGVRGPETAPTTPRCIPVEPARPLLLVRLMNNNIKHGLVAVLSLLGALAGCAVDVPDDELASEEQEIVAVVPGDDPGTCQAAAIAVCVKEYSDCKEAAETTLTNCIDVCYAEYPAEKILQQYEACWDKHGPKDPVCAAILAAYKDAYNRRSECAAKCHTDYQSDLKSCAENACCGIAAAGHSIVGPE